MQLGRSGSPGSMTYLKVANSAGNSPARTLRQQESLPESVDLLQMVPQARPKTLPPRSPEYPRSPTPRTCRYPVVASPSHSRSHSLDSNARRPRMVILPEHADEDTSNADESDSGIHTCHGCKNCGIYYDRHEPPATVGGPWPSAHEEGSIYFNYIQFAKNPHRTCPSASSSKGGSHYEPVYRAPSRHKSTPSVFASCCRGHSDLKSSPTRNNYNPSGTRPRATSRNNTTSSTTYQFPATCRDDDCGDNYMAAGSCDRLHEAKATSLRRPVRKARKKPWSRVKRLIVLVSIMLGILLALGGMVVGFVVLGPFDGVKGQ